MIDFQILLGGGAPGEVGSHAGLLQGAPGGLVAAVESGGLPQDPDHVPGVDVGEGEVRLMYRFTDIYNQVYWSEPISE